MNKADAMGFVLAAVARLITGAQGHWKGVPPKAEQRIYFANHQIGRASCRERVFRRV